MKQKGKGIVSVNVFVNLFFYRLRKKSEYDKMRIWDSKIRAKAYRQMPDKGNERRKE